MIGAKSVLKVPPKAAGSGSPVRTTAAKVFPVLVRRALVVPRNAILLALAATGWVKKSSLVPSAAASPELKSARTVSAEAATGDSAARIRKTAARRPNIAERNSSTVLGYRTA